MRGVQERWNAMVETLQIMPMDAPETPPDVAPTTGTPALMTSVDLAGELQISERTIRRLEITGKIGPRPVNIGRAVRYRREEIARWIEAGCPDRGTWQGGRTGKKR
jgi:predicted DNA-binding transcriptional regulator AlpA